MTVHAAGSIELQRTQARVWFERLRDDICAEIDALERQAPDVLFPDEPARFVRKPRKRNTGPRYHVRTARRRQCSSMPPAVSWP